MQIKLEDIIDAHKGKRAFISALGPSLNEVLPQFEEMSKDENNDDVFISCNLYKGMCDIQTDYFIVANNQPVMSIVNAHSTYNKTKSTMLFSSRINGFSPELAKKHLTCDWISMIDVPSEKNSLQNFFKDYVEGDVYGAVYTVLCHMVAIAVIVGCKDIYIAGADLNYARGYVKPDFHKSGVVLGRTFMDNNAKTITLKQIKKMRENAEKKGVKIYSLNKTSPLCQVLEYKNINELKDDRN